MIQNYLPLDFSIPRPRPLNDPMNFQVGYAREPMYIRVQSDPVEAFNSNVFVAPPPQTITTTTTTTTVNLTPYFIIGGVVVLVLMMPRR